MLGVDTSLIPISGYREVMLLIRVDEYNIGLAHFWSPITFFYKIFLLL